MDPLLSDRYTTRLPKGTGARLAKRVSFDYPQPGEFIKGTSDWNSTVGKAQTALDQYGYGLSGGEAQQLEQITEPGRGFWDGFWDFLDAPLNTVKLPWIMQQHTANREGTDTVKDWLGMLGAIWSSNDEYITHYAPSLKEEDGSANLSSASLLKETFGLEDNLGTNIGTAAAGLVLDIALDPLSWVSWGTLGFGKGMAREAAEAAGKVATKEATAVLIREAAEESLSPIAKRAMNEIIEKSAATRSEMLTARLAELGDDVSEETVRLARQQINDEVFRREYHMARRGLGEEGFIGPQFKFSNTVEGIYEKGLPKRWDKSVRSSFGEEMVEDLSTLTLEKKFRTLAEKYPEIAQTPGTHLWEGGVRLTTPFFRRKAGAVNLGIKTDRKLTEPARRVIGNTWAKLPDDSRMRTMVRDIWRRRGYEVPAQEAARQRDVWRHSYVKNFFAEQMHLLGVDNPQGDMKLILRNLDKVALAEGFDASRAQELLFGLRTGDITPTILRESPEVPRGTTEAIIAAERELDSVFKTLHGALSAFGDTVGNIEHYLPLIESRDMKNLMQTVVDQGIRIPRDDMLKYADALQSSDPVRAALLRNGAELLDLLISKAMGAKAIAKESGDKVVADWTRFMNHRVIGTSVFSDLGGVTLMNKEALLKAFSEEAGRIGTNSHYLMNRAIDEALKYMNERGSNFKLSKGFEAFSTDLPDVLDSYAKAAERVVRFKAAIRAGEEMALHRSLDPATEVGLTLAQHYSKYEDPELRILIEEFAGMVDGKRGKVIGHGTEKVSIGNGVTLDLPKGYAHVPQLTRALGDAMEASKQAASNIGAAVDAAVRDVAALKNMGVPEEFAGELAGLVSSDAAVSRAVTVLWDVYHERIKALSSMTNELAGRRTPEEIAAALDDLTKVVADEYEATKKAAQDLATSWRKTVRLPGRVGEGTVDLTKKTADGRHAGEWFAAKIRTQLEKHLDQLAQGSMDPQARKMLMDPDTPLDVRLQLASMKPQSAQQVETAGVLQTWSEARALVTQANLSFDELVGAMGAEGTVRLLQTLAHLDGPPVLDAALDDALRSMVTEFTGRSPIPITLGDNLGDLDGIADDYMAMIDVNLHPGLRPDVLEREGRQPISEAFAELRRQTQEQIRFLEDRGYEFVPTRGMNPYQDVASLAAGVQGKNILVHTARDLQAAPTLLEPVVFGSGLAVPFIDAFDTLHQVLGHAPYGFAFDDARGITSAWAHHIQAYEGEDVRSAFTTLTRSRRIAALKGGEYANLPVKMDLPDGRISQLFSAAVPDESMVGYQIGRADREGISEAVDITDAPGWNIDFENLAKQSAEDQVVQGRIGEKYALLPTEGMSKAEQESAAAVARAWDRAKKGRFDDAVDALEQSAVDPDLYDDIYESLEEASKYGLNEVGKFQVGFANSGLPELVQQAKQLDVFRADAMTAWGKLPNEILSNQGGFMVTFRDGSAPARFFSTKEEVEAFVRGRVEAAQASFDAFSVRAASIPPAPGPSVAGMTDEELARWKKFHEPTKSGESAFGGGTIDERGVQWQQARDQLEQYDEAGRLLGEPPIDPNDLDVEATRMVEEHRLAQGDPYYPASAIGEDDRPPPLPRDPFNAKDLPVLGSAEGMDNLDPEVLRMIEEDVTSARRAADRLPNQKDLMPTGQEIPSRELLDDLNARMIPEDAFYTDVRPGRGPVRPLKVTPEKGIISVGNDGVIRLSAQTERQLQREMAALRQTVENSKRAYQQGAATLAQALKDQGFSLRELMEEVPSTLRSQGLKHPLFDSPTQVTPIMRETGRPAAADQVADALLTERQDQWRKLLAAAFEKSHPGKGLDMADHWRAAQRGKIESLVNDNSMAGLFDAIEGVRVMGGGRGITHALAMGDWDAILGEDGGETFRHILRLVGIDDSRLITMERGDGSWVVRWGDPTGPLANIPSYRGWRGLLEDALGNAGPTLVRRGPDDLGVRSLRELLFEAKSKNIRVPGLEDLMELVGEKGHLPRELEEILHLDEMASRMRLLGEGQRRTLLDQQFEAPLRKILDILDGAARGTDAKLDELAKLWEAHKADLSKWLPGKDWHALSEMIEQAPQRAQALTRVRLARGTYSKQMLKAEKAYAAARSTIGNMLNELTVDQQNFWMPAIEGTDFFMNRYMSILEKARTTEPERYKLDVLGGYFEPYYNQVYSQPLDQAHLAEEIADMNALADRMAQTIRTMPFEQKNLLHERLTQRLTEMSLQEGESLNSWVMRRISDLEKETDVVTFGSRGDLAGFVPQGTFHLNTKELQGRMLEENFGLLLESLASHVAAVQSPLGIKLFKEQFNRFERWWKAAVTVGKPTFVPRNIMGGTFNNMAIDVGGREYRWLSNQAVKVRRAMRHMSFEDAISKVLSPEDAEVFRAAHARKIFDTEFSADLITSPWKERKLNPFSADFIGFDYGGRFMQASEDFMRMAAFKRWYDPSNPASADIAAALVNTVHFDYGNLTRMENSIKKFVPFYVWSRRNIPLQFRMLAENPGFTNRYNHLMSNLRGGFYNEDDPANGLPIPGWMGSAAAAIGFNRHSEDSWTRFILSPDIPVRDLEQVLNAFTATEGGPIVGAAEWLAGMTSPLIKVPIDLLQKSAYDSDVEAPWGMAQIMQMMDAIPGFQFAYMDEDTGTVQVPAWARSAWEGVIPFQRDWQETAGIVGFDPARAQRLNVDTSDGVSMGEHLIASVLSMAKSVGLRGATPADLQQETIRTNDLISNVLKAPLAENRILQTESGEPLGREDLAKIAGDPFAGGFGPPRAGGKGATVKVDRVIDGDTLVLENGERIRVAFVNTPELGTPGGELAKDYLMEAVMSGATIEVARDGWDKYAGGTRTVGEVWINGVNLADALIGAGLGGYWRG